MTSSPTTIGCGMLRFSASVQCTGSNPSHGRLPAMTTAQYFQNGALCCIIQRKLNMLNPRKNNARSGSGCGHRQSSGENRTQLITASQPTKRSSMFSPYLARYRHGTRNLGHHPMPQDLSSKILLCSFHVCACIYSQYLHSPPPARRQ